MFLENDMKAKQILIQAAKSGVSVYALCLRAFNAAVSEGIAVAGLKGEAGNAEHAKLMAWANDILKAHKGSADAIGNICRKCASVALVPDAVGIVEQGKGDKASRTEVRVKGIKTRRDLTAVAAAANKVLGRVKQANSGTTVPTPADDAKRSEVTAAEAEAKIVAAATKSSMALAEALTLALDGNHGALRQTVVDVLAKHGFKLAPISVTAKAEAPKPTKTPTTKRTRVASGKRASV